ncbi:hypothetical protein B0H16DRAFT_1731863 [Mycena metata]|uniref:Uncharacterized protein n=1 Tax=Mycena metata TaxID=1033252 RepID=A0AAD7I3K6_9AGAR|nr:hypothetical protein B0H16DRAFT_1731863 [Mycena metata]
MPSSITGLWSEESRLAAIHSLQHATPPSPAHLTHNWHRLQAAPLPPIPRPALLASKIQFSDKEIAKFGSQKSNFSDNPLVELPGACRKTTGLFLGLGKDKDKERERDRQCIREAERGQPSASAAELLTPHESGAGGFDADELNSASCAWNARMHHARSSTLVSSAGRFALQSLGLIFYFFHPFHFGRYFRQLVLPPARVGTWCI